MNIKAYTQGYLNKSARRGPNLSPETVAMYKGSRPGIRLGGEYDHIERDKEISATSLRTHPELGKPARSDYIKGKPVLNRRTDMPEGSKIADADTQATPRKIQGK
jgi:hypothetical protein